MINTYRHILFIVLTVIISVTASANKQVFAIDSSKKPYDLSEQEFLSKYGNDDTSRALIRYYFQRKKVSAKTGLIAGGTAGGLGILAFIYSQNDNGLDNLGTAILLGIGIVTFAFIGVLSAAIYLKTSKKSLYKLIRGYHAGRKIPKKITWRPLFKKFLKEEKNKK
jgi:hypothetical protein